jgi:hypothetical protein
MGLVKRGKRMYFFRTMRLGRAGRRCYVGTGIVARLAGETDAYLRERHNTRRDTLRQIDEDLGTLNRTAEQLSTYSELLARAHLLLAGWYLHAKAEWRRRCG